MKKGYILPTPVEILREIAGCLDIKNRNKTLDDKVADPLLHPIQLRALIQNMVHEPITRISSENFANGLSTAIETFINIYCRKMAGHGFFIGSKRQHALLTLNQYFFPLQMAPILRSLLAQFQRFNIPNLETLLNGTSAFDVVWHWCENHISLWEEFHQETKEQKDQIRSWRSGEHLPDLQSLKRLIPTEVMPVVMPLLLIARMLDMLRKKSWGKRLILGLLNLNASKNSAYALQAEVNKHTTRYFARFDKFIYKLSTLEKTLVKHHKTLDDYQNAVQLLTEIRQFEQNRIPLNGNGLVSWLEGRLYAQSGKLDAATHAYKNALEKMLYGAGNYLNMVINEALTVASAKVNPDRVFLKKLKTAQILFGYDIPSAEFSPDQKQQRFEDTIENWEIEIWRKGFFSNFKAHSLFPGVTYPDMANFGPLLINSQSEFKPDYQKPDKTVRVGESWQRTMPQLNFSILIGDYNATKNLIEEGASLDVYSEVGDTPLLLALGHLDLMEIPYVSLDKRFYDLIIEGNMSPETLNRRTQKKRLLPLLQAVRTGKLEIVKKVIQLGADVNRRGFTDKQTALNEIIKMIGAYKKPKQAKEIMMEHPLTPELLDATRRHTAGDIGMSLPQCENYLNQLNATGLFHDFSSSAIDLILKRLIENTSIHELRLIATLLIESGADSNAEHTSPRKGYTPLILAAELDEGELFKQMCMHGGDPSKSYYEPQTQTKHNSWEVAGFWRSKTVLALRH
jgi:tetratricopeptide (TPR) repeat protein